MKKRLLVVSMITALLGLIGINTWLWMKNNNLKDENLDLEIRLYFHDNAESERSRASLVLNKYLTTHYPEAKFPDYLSSEDVASAPLGSHIGKETKKFRVISYCDAIGPNGVFRVPFDAVMVCYARDKWRIEALTINGEVIQFNSNKTSNQPNQ